MGNLYYLLIKDLSRICNTSERSKISIYLMILKYFIISNSFRVIFFYRLSSSSFSRIIILNGIIRIANFLLNFKFRLHPTIIIGEGLNIPHPDCIIIHPDVVIGKNATILQGVTIGRNLGKTKNGRTVPIIGNNVFIGAGAKIIGPVKIGDNSMIGVNAVVTKDIPKNSVAVGIPAKIIKKVDKPFIEIQKSYYNL